jgi:LytS/YehU family sensor histidine kinase
MNMLEQKALRSQMNPHFIFNSLSAIQHYINNEEATNADKYLTMFSRLIRKTLNNSNEATISIEKEISYLENYILLEQMRFKDKFSYAIICEETIDKANTYLPTMLLQPFVENAIRHGLMYKENNDGRLIIHFFKQDNQLVCTIDDNGIGIIASQQMKTNAHIEYQSKGITISSERIDTINAINQQKIVLKIEDKNKLPTLLSGTLITLTIS